eukprot:Pgem_evm1s16189
MQIWGTENDIDQIRKNLCTAFAITLLGGFIIQFSFISRQRIIYLCLQPKQVKITFLTYISIAPIFVVTYVCCLIPFFVIGFSSKNELVYNGVDIIYIPAWLMMCVVHPFVICYYTYQTRSGSQNVGLTIALWSKALKSGYMWVDLLSLFVAQYECVVYCLDIATPMIYAWWKIRNSDIVFNDQTMRMHSSSIMNVNTEMEGKNSCVSISPKSNLELEHENIEDLEVLEIVDEDEDEELTHDNLIVNNEKIEDSVINNEKKEDNNEVDGSFI